METYKLLLLTLLAAVLLGCGVGVFLGKYQLKIRKPNYKPLLSKKEKILYSVSVFLGAVCIAVGALYSPPRQLPPDGMGEMAVGDSQSGLEDQPMTLSGEEGSATEAETQTGEDSELVDEPDSGKTEEKHAVPRRSSGNRVVGGNSVTVVTPGG